MHLGQRQVQQPGQRHQVAQVQHPEVVIEAVQVFDQQVAPETLGRALAQQGRHLGQGGVFRLAALEAAFAADQCAQIIWRGHGHRSGVGARLGGGVGQRGHGAAQLVKKVAGSVAAPRMRVNAAIPTVRLPHGQTEAPARAQSVRAPAPVR